jgi:hypothetical protein
MLKRLKYLEEKVKGREQGQAIQMTKKINLLNLDLTPFNP